MNKSAKSLSIDADQQQEDRQRYRIPIQWCLLSALMILSFHPSLPGGRSILMPSTGDTIFSEPGDWHIPFTQSEWTREWGSIPFPFMVCLGSLAIGFLTQSLIKRFGPAAGIVALISLSYGFEDRHFLTALFLALLAYLSTRIAKESPDKRVGILLILILLMTLFTTLEIGFVCLFWMLLFVPRLLSTSSRQWLRHSDSWGTIGGGLLMMIGGLKTGLWKTILRPWSAVTSPVYPDLFDSLGPVFGAGVPTLAQLFLVLTLLMCWFQVISERGRTRTVFACLSLSSLLGLLCGYYLWLSVVASLLCLCATSQRQKRTGDSLQHAKALGAAVTFTIVAICLVSLSRPGTVLRNYLIEGTLVAHRIDPIEWTNQGPALLLDLDRCSEWLDGHTSEQYPPVIDDRWDLYGNHYADYAALVRDLKEMRALLYFRTDQKFGGYLHRVKDWKPLLVVAETEEEDAIRDLSLSPHWKMIAIDGQSTYFGRDDDPHLRQRIQTAGRTFLNLEWPDKQASPPSPQVIAASTPTEARRIAGAMNAIRLPYAALHMLPGENTIEDQKIQAWSYLELSYRMHRNTGLHSLLDEYRALTLIRELAAQKQWTNQESERLLDSLRGLGLDFMGGQLFETALAEEGSEMAFDGQKTLQGLGTKDQLRLLIRSGDTESAKDLIETLPQALRPFYSLILSSKDQPLAELAKSMYSLVESGKLPVELKSELLFYLGCVAIEVGDHAVAVQALTQSQQVAPESGLSPLRITYLQQLRSH